MVGSTFPYIFLTATRVALACLPQKINRVHLTAAICCPFLITRIANFDISDVDLICFEKRVQSFL